MKKFIYLLATIAFLAACNGKNGYQVSGTVENATDGEIVYLQKPEGRQLQKLDSAIIQNGKFTLKGKQDTALVCYLTYKGKNLDDGKSIDFFLENGQINIQLTADNHTATGTPNNDIYQAIRQQLNDLNKQIFITYESMSDTTLTDEQREAKAKEMETLDKKMVEATNVAIAQNITNAVGIYLLKRNYYNMSVKELDPLIAQIPAEYANDEAIVKIKNNVEKLKITAEGQKFTDFTMLTPDGKEIKLSDYVGKGKVVLIDFWASWCGPCRREMPNLVEIYKKYKGRSFEIIGVSLDRDAEAWKKGIEQLHMTWPQMSDLKYWDCEGARLYAVSSIPHTVLIDGEGIILSRGLHGEELQEKIAEALK